MAAREEVERLKATVMEQVAKMDKISKEIVETVQAQGTLTDVEKKQIVDLVAVQPDKVELILEKAANSQSELKEDQLQQILAQREEEIRKMVEQMHTAVQDIAQKGFRPTYVYKKLGMFGDSIRVFNPRDVYFTSLTQE